VPHSTVTDIDVDVLADPPRVRLTGNLDIQATRELRSVLLGLLSMGHADVTVDLGAVTGVDPSVPDLFAEMWERGLVLQLRNPSIVARERLHLEAS
jgi:anti-anti-sigma regulatory factor